MTMGALGLGAVLGLLAVIAAAPWWVRAPVRRAGRAADAGAQAGGARRRAARAARARPAVDEAVVLDLVRAALRTGTDTVGAIEAVGAALPPAQGERYLRAGRALRLGALWDSAWGGAAAAPDALARALSPAWSDGVDPEPLLAHSAATIRKNRQAQAREAAARLGVRLVLPLGLCLLPAFVLLGLVPLLISAGMQLWGG